MYQFSSDFFRPDGGVTFADFATARKFASQMSAHRTQPVPASDIYAMQLIDEALRLLVRTLCTGSSHEQRCFLRR